jgi:hypothetical protein
LGFLRGRSTRDEEGVKLTDGRAAWHTWKSANVTVRGDRRTGMQIRNSRTCNEQLERQ